MSTWDVCSSLTHNSYISLTYLTTNKSAFNSLSIPDNNDVPALASGKSFLNFSHQPLAAELWAHTRVFALRILHSFTQINSNIVWLSLVTWHWHVPPPLSTSDPWPRNISCQWWCPTWAWVKRTLLLRLWDSGNWICCLASMEHPVTPVRPLIFDGIPPMLLLGPLIKLETKQS